MKAPLDSQLTVRDLLKACFERLQEKNAAYSMRAFARDLKISSAALSEIIRGKRFVSKQKALTLLGLAGVGPGELAKVAELFDNRSALKKRKLTMKSLKEDDYALISHWLHFAILALMETDDFRSDVAWIAQRLASTQSQVEACLERLLRLGLIRQGSAGKLLHSGAQYCSSDGVPSDAVKESHRRHFALAHAALEKFHLEHRYNSTLTLAIDPKKLPKARKMIVDFEKKLAGFLERGGKKSEVYKIGVQVFPLTQE